MNKKEKTPFKNAGFDNATSLLSTGKWDENISWEFILSPEIPDRNLCTAVCCVVTYDRKLILVRNIRGWEIPAGKVEEETIEQAVVREVGEETGAIVNNPQFFGYKKLTAVKPVSRANNPDVFYPFPTSYVAFFHAEATAFSEKPLARDVEKTTFATYSQAQELLEASGQYAHILEYLQKKRLITVE